MTAQPTLLPATFAPAVPFTAAPTVAPPTTAPATDAPDTEAPETPLPTVNETAAPETEAPPAVAAAIVTTPIPVLVGSTVEKAPGADSTVSAASAVSTSGGRIKALMEVDCKVEDVDLDHVEPLDWEFHPLQFPIGTHEHKYFLGAVVCNFGLLLVFLAVNYLIALAQVSLFGISWGTALFYVRAPGLVYVPLVWLLMGTSMSASNMAFFPSRAPPGVAVVGWVGLLACAAIPVAMWVFLLQPSKFCATPVPDPRVDAEAAAIVAQYLHTENDEGGVGDDAPKQKEVLHGWRRTAYIFVFGKEVWVRCDGAPEHYVAEWGLFFETYRGQYHWFSIVEMLQIMFLAFASAWKPTDFGMCVTRNVLITLMLLAFFLAIILLRPYNSTFDFLIAAIMSGLMFLAVLMMSISIMLQGSPKGLVDVLTSVAGFSLFLSAMILAAKGAYDICLYIFDIKIGRRKGAMDAAQRGCVGDWQNKQNARLATPLKDADVLTHMEELSVLPENASDSLSVGGLSADLATQPLVQSTVGQSSALMPEDDAMLGMSSKRRELGVASLVAFLDRDLMPNPAGSAALPLGSSRAGHTASSRSLRRPSPGSGRASSRYDTPRDTPVSRGGRPPNRTLSARQLDSSGRYTAIDYV